MSKVSGAWTSMVGCSAAGNFHALKRTPATYSPDRPVGVSGTSRPLQATAWRAALKTSTFTCSRSTEESTKRAGTPAVASSPSTCHGSSAWRNSSGTPPRGAAAEDRKPNPRRAMKPLRIEVIAGAAKTFQNVEKVVPNEVRQHESVVQGRTPTYRRAALWLAPEPGDQRAQEQLLRQAHARVRRHFERAELYEAQP